LNNIFDYRHRAIEEIFASPERVPDSSPDAIL
jgi:hypothetical protein